MKETATAQGQEEDDLSMDSADETVNEGKFKETMAQIEPKFYDADVDLKVKLEIIDGHLRDQSMDNKYYINHLSFLRRLIGTNHIEVVPIFCELKMMDTLVPFFKVSLALFFFGILLRTNKCVFCIGT